MKKLSIPGILKLKTQRHDSAVMEKSILWMAFRFKKNGWDEKEEYSLQLLAAPSQYLHLNQRENKKDKDEKMGGKE